jgi:hypothetical protein
VTPILAIVVPRRGVVRWWPDRRTVEPLPGSWISAACEFWTDVAAAVAGVDDHPHDRHAEADLVLRFFEGSYVVVLGPGEPLTIPPEISKPLPPKWRGPLRRRQRDAAARRLRAGRP